MSKKELVTTSVSVSFSTTNNVEIKAQVDDRSPANGGFNSTTSFKPGDPVVWLLFKTSTVTILDIIPSHGSSSGGGSTTYLVEENISVSGAFDASLGYPYTSAWSASWLGSGGIQPAINPPKVGDTSITFNSSNPQYKKYGAVGVIKATYNSTAQKHTLTHSPITGESEYEIVIFIAGEG